MLHRRAVSAGPIPAVYQPPTPPALAPRVQLEDNSPDHNLVAGLETLRFQGVDHSDRLQPTFEVGEASSLSMSNRAISRSTPTPVTSKA